MSLQRGFPCQESSPSSCHLPALSSLVYTTVLESDEVPFAASPFDYNRGPHDCSDFEISLFLSEWRPIEKDARSKLHDDCLELLDISISTSATHSDLRLPFKQDIEAGLPPFHFAEPTSEDCGVEYTIPPSIARQQTPNGSTLSKTLARHDPETQCRYRNGKCAQPRTNKKNGALHTLCEWHRGKSCVNQKAFDSKKRHRSSKGAHSQSKSQCTSRRSAKRPQDDTKPNTPSKGTRRSRRLEASSLRQGDGDEDLFQAFTLVLDSNQQLQLQMPALTQFLVCGGSVVTAVHSFDEHALDMKRLPAKLHI